MYHDEGFGAGASSLEKTQHHLDMRRHASA